MIWSLIKQFISRWRGLKPTVSLVWPTREEIALLPPFEGLDPTDIVVVSTPDGAKRAHLELMKATVLGFDTESKPTFLKGQASTGPHVMQFSTLKRAYVFMLENKECREIAGSIIASGSIKKVGFGLNDDLKRIRIKLGVEPQSVIDIETLFRAKGYGRGVGAKVGIAIAFNRRLLKSKKTGTSNWGASRLTDRQLLYAANDAFAAIRVYHALK